MLIQTQPQSAYETIYTCLDLAFSSLSIPDLFDRIIAGISDEGDIRTLSTLMLSKLTALAPADVESRLDLFAAPFTAILTFKPKDTAVKQELEKAAEAVAGVLKTTVELRQAFPGSEAGTGGGEHVAWRDYVEAATRDFKQMIKDIEGK